MTPLRSYGYAKVVMDMRKGVVVRQSRGDRLCAFLHERVVSGINYLQVGDTGDPFARGLLYF